MRRVAWILVASIGLLGAAPSEEAVRLRNEGLALLENEQPADAERIFRELTSKAPDDPLPWANLAVAALRQQSFEVAREAIAEAKERAPGDGPVLAIEAEIHHWSGDDAKALEVLRRAAKAAPDDAQIQYALYRQAGVVEGEAADAAAAEALERLARLRPENVVVLLQLGIRAREGGDRAAATRAFLRLDELIWQAQPAARQMLDMVLEALEAGELEEARLPALRLENVLKISPMYREGLRELSLGIQGVPLTRFRDEPPIESFGKPAPVRFAGTRLSETPTRGRALAVGDFDGDEAPDIARIAAGEPPRLEIRLAAGGWEASGMVQAAGGVEALLAVDLDNDGLLDLIGHGDDVVFWKGNGAGGFADATDELGLASAAGSAAEAFDFDIEGDLDLALAGGPLELWRNALAGALEPVGERAFPDLTLRGARAMRASDWDRDGDLDLLVGHEGGVTLLDNLRQGELADVTAAAGLTGQAPVSALASADLDHDGLPDLVLAGRGVRLLRNLGGSYEAWQPGGLQTAAEFGALEAADFDNDGRLDLAVAGEVGLAVAARRPGGDFGFLDVEGGPAGAAALAAADLDRDGDLDLVAAGAEGLHRLDNRGGDANGWLSVRLRGLDKGNSKNNLLGRGAALEVRAGRAYQFREATSDVVHFGLGALDSADLRVVWTNGVPQNRLDLSADQRIVEEQVLKGSCPFLYAWDGEGVRFVTDLLWGAPIGLPLAPGRWMGADPTELVRVDGAVADHGLYDLRITEELWEAAYFDLVRLWVVDHPAEVEVASALRIVPGGATPEEVRATRALRPVAEAWDAAGRPVGDRVRDRDDVYADGWRRGRYQGVASEPWSFTVDLGEAPAAPVRLHLDGWIFPTDASLNLALAQRRELEHFPPRLEVETADGWRVLMPSMGFPAGKTKTMVVDTPPLPAGARRLRIVTTQWLSWDRIAWSPSPADGEPVVRARLAPSTAELGFRGFSAIVRRAPNAPHEFDYSRVTAESPWLPFPGRYTRYGDVRELLLEADDRSVILAAGDEVRLTFDASELPPPAAGWRRTVFLESHGWDKDADRNTGEGLRVGPLPFRAMSGYPYGSDEAFPDTPLHRRYVEEWLTRVVTPPAPAAEPRPVAGR